MMVFVSLLGCMKSREFKLDENEWPVEFEIYRGDDDRLKVRVFNLTHAPITTKVTYDGELIHGGIYAYDSLFCADKQIKLSVISDFFNTKVDTIQPEEIKEYFTSLYSPFIAEVLDSTSIYSFNFDLDEPENSQYTHYIVCARGEDGFHRMRNAANKIVDSNDIVIRFELNEMLCQPELLTVESLF